MNFNAEAFVCLLFLSIITVKGERNVKNLEELAVKTIKSEDGDVIHCVDIYKQPALNHPLLQNHSTEMSPTSYQTIEGVQYSLEEEIFQVWQKNGSCPEGTIPIRKTSEEEDGTFGTLEEHGATRGRLLTWKWNRQHISRMEFAGLSSSSPDRPYFGLRGRMTIWRPLVEAGEKSGAAISIHGRQNSLYLGWMVDSPFARYSRLFIACTGEDEEELRFNLDCPGFVQSSTRMVLGGSILKRDRSSNIVGFVIFKGNQERWYAAVGNEIIGYWSETFFESHFAPKKVMWTGFVQNTAANGKHTSTYMGNGQRPGNGRESAFIDDVSVMEPAGDFVVPQATLNKLESFPRCYSAVLVEAGSIKRNIGIAVYYGGIGTGVCDANLIPAKGNFNGRIRG